MPLIAITPDIVEPSVGKVRTQSSVRYVDAVANAGGMPVLLAPIEALIPEQLKRFDGFVLTGGDDPRMEPFGGTTHPGTTSLHPRRQAYEMALIRALLAAPEIPVLGICLGMQMIALCAGGELDQYLPDHLPSADQHRYDAVHPVEPRGETWLAPGSVTSYHKQAVRTCPSGFKVTAESPDRVIEAIESTDPRAAFCVGVQWHPERTDDANLGLGVLMRFVAAAARYGNSR